jgi:hypothetical protein
MQAVILRLRAVSCCGLTTISPRGRGAARHPHDHAYGDEYYSIDGYLLRIPVAFRFSDAPFLGAAASPGVHWPSQSECKIGVDSESRPYLPLRLLPGAFRKVWR